MVRAPDHMYIDLCAQVYLQSVLCKCQGVHIYSWLYKQQVHVKKCDLVPSRNSRLGTPPVLPMKCACCSLVSNDNIKQIYSHATHSNGKGEHAHTDMLRYVIMLNSNCLQLFLCMRLKRIDRDRRYGSWGLQRKMVDECIRRGNRRTEREEEGQGQSSKYMEEKKKGVK